MSTLLARLGRGTCLAVLVALAPGGASASLSGAYLAAMQADFRNDYVAAADYVDQALVSDPDNPGLLQNGIVANVAEGDATRGGELAERMLKIVPDHQLAIVVRLAGQIAAEEWDAAGETLKAAGPALNPLLSGLLTGWIAVGREDYDAAFAAFDAMTGNEALVAYGQYHKALALALAGDFNQAATILQGDANGPLHLNLGAVVARVQILAQIDRTDEARAILDAALADGIPNAVLIDLRRRLEAGEEVGFTKVGDARGGAAEAFLTLADALDTPETERLALIHARLASQIDPGEVEAQLVASEILDREGQPKLAAAALADVPADSPWFVTSEIRRAATQRAAGDAEAGIATLEALRAAHPQEIEVHSALGDALRIAERFPEAAVAYDGAIALADPPQPAHWALFYTRGIARERSGDWDGAETDFREALVLSPDQPLVLNYLGYSLVERRKNLDEALAMIEKAVQGEPEDGYITDSLGWVLYRLGRYEEAVKPMMRAVELTPADAVINDHLGDVLWKVGRTREAEFQWRRALSLGPTTDLDMDRIRRKLAEGLDAVLAAEAAAPTPTVPQAPAPAVPQAPTSGPDGG